MISSYRFILHVYMFLLLIHPYFFFFEKKIVLFQFIHIKKMQTFGIDINWLGQWNK